MAEQRMKVRDKKVQKMTKDGLVEENLTDKSSVRVSNRASDVQMGVALAHVLQKLRDQLTGRGRIRLMTDQRRVLDIAHALAVCL